MVTTDQGLRKRRTSHPYEAISEQLTGDRMRMRSREVAYLAVKAAILNGILEPRERLIEERLGEALELSRTPIREALAILEHEGLIESIPYKGLMVRSLSVPEFLSMYEALGVIESAVARSAVAHITEEAVLDLLQILDRAEQCVPDDVPGHLAACRQFQQRLGEAAQSPFLTQLLVSIEERSDVYLIHSHQALPKENMLAAVNDRRTILAAVQSGNPEAAARAAETHAEAIRLRWKGLYVRDHSDVPNHR